MGRPRTLNVMTDCNDTVYRVLNTPTYSPDGNCIYKNLLIRVSDEDLKEALNILEKEDLCLIKQREIRRELEVRKNQEGRVVRYPQSWLDRFSQEWIMTCMCVRKGAGYARNL